MNEATVGCVGLTILLLLFFTGLELPFCMILVGFAGFSYVVNFQAAAHMTAKDIYDVFVNYGYTVFPLFIFMGQIAFVSGIAKKLYDSAYRFFGHIPGGLGIATIGGATAFKALCGSAVATAATFSNLAIPEMNRYGYNRTLSTGLVAIVGTLGCLIPPTIFLIIYGLTTEQSIGALFLAGIIPGLVIAMFFVLTLYIWAKLNPSIAPAGEKSTWKQRIASLPEVAVVLCVFVIMIVGLLNGFFTPTEAGAVGTMVVLIMVTVTRQLTLRRYVEAIADAMRTACMLLMLIAGSAVLGHFITVTNSPQNISDWVSILPVHRNVVMIIICLVYLVGGSFIDDLAFMILATPVFYPTVQKLGFDPIWFGILIAVTVMIGIVIPPVASSVFIVHKLTDTPMSTVYRGVMPFLAAIVLFGVLLFIFPQLALFLPNYFMGN
ncbi:MAG TPA: TRAP transporter large permease [Syntrophorhabdaceae bacterium]|nr:TRAP transporter large permease [Syntrophorhabdaceae bacterium]